MSRPFIAAVQRVVLEAALIGLHFGAYLTALALVLDPGKMAVFVLVQHAFLGLYLGAIFAPNHKGMPVRDGDELDWIHRQVLTARNLRSTILTDFLFGGLNYHIEHHLFPTMARPNLRRARPIVIDYCQKNGLSYCEVSVTRSYLDIIQYLATVSREWCERQSQA